jgi:GH18 family chitinase
MKKKLLFVLFAFGLLTTFKVEAQKAVGYYPYYKSSVSSVPYAEYTDMVYAFIKPSSSTGLLYQDSYFDKSEYNTMVNLTHNAGGKAHISVGGANNSESLYNVIRSSTKRAACVADIVKFVSGKHSLGNVQIDGVDIDWEDWHLYYQTGDDAKHLLFIQELRVALDAQSAADGKASPYEIAIAVGGSTPNMPGNYIAHTTYFKKAVKDYVDHIYVMNYDLNYAYGHNSPVKAATDALAYYSSQGYDMSKIFIGIPFYGRYGYADGTDGTPYKNFANQQYFDDSDGNLNGHQYNSAPMIREKVNAICDKGAAGVLVWEVTHDKTGSYSLIKVINESFNNSCSESQCSKPNLGEDETICGDDVVLNSNTDPTSSTYKWYLNGQLISNASSNTYTANQPGTYKVERDSGDCSKSDEIVVTQSGALTATASNNGYICESTGPNNVDISVSGGGGSYNFYDEQNGGNLLSGGSGVSTYNFTSSMINNGEQKTVWVEEPAAQSSNVGPTGFFSSGWNADYSAEGYDNRIVFTTYTAVTILSADFYLAFAAGADNNKVEVTIYEHTGAAAGTNVIANVIVDLSEVAPNWNDWNTLSLNLQLPDAGSYQMSFKGTNCYLRLDQVDGENLYDPAYSESGVISIIDNINATNPDWANNMRYGGAYNWSVKTGVGASGCGRVPVEIYHDCTTGKEDLNLHSVSLYPNPASDFMNIEFTLGTSTNGYITMYNSVGGVVKSINVNNIGGTITKKINTSDLSNGLYFVKVKSGDVSSVKTVSITK